MKFVHYSLVLAWDGANSPEYSLTTMLRHFITVSSFICYHPENRAEVIALQGTNHSWDHIVRLGKEFMPGRHSKLNVLEVYVISNFVPKIILHDNPSDFLQASREFFLAAFIDVLREVHYTAA